MITFITYSSDTVPETPVDKEKILTELTQSLDNNSASERDKS